MRNDIILTFANLLVGNKIDTQTIIHSLKLICDNFYLTVDFFMKMTLKILCL